MNQQLLSWEKEGQDRGPWAWLLFIGLLRKCGEEGRWLTIPHSSEYQRLWSMVPSIHGNGRNRQWVCLQGSVLGSSWYLPCRVLTRAFCSTEYKR